MLFGVFKVIFKFVPCFIDRFEARGDFVQLAVAANLFRLLVHFGCRFANMLDRIVNHAKTEKRSDSALHAFPLGRKGNICFDEAQCSVPVSEKDLSQLGWQFVIDQCLRRVYGRGSGIVQREQFYGRSRAPRLAVNIFESRTHEAETPPRFPHITGHTSVCCQLEFDGSGDWHTPAVTCFPVDGMKAKSIALAGQRSVAVKRPLQRMKDRRLARFVCRADNRQILLRFAGELKLQIAEQPKVLEFCAE